MKDKHVAVRSGLGWLLLAACVILTVWVLADGCHQPQRTGYAASGRMADLHSIPVQTGPIPVNTADATLLMELPNIGAAMAERIMAERALNGQFYYPEDLMHVKGIGEKKLEEMRDLLDLTEETP